MRKLTVGLLISLVLILIGASAYAETMMLEYDGDVHEYNGEVYSLVVNNCEIDPPLSPIIFNDRALVPVREIFEEVGAEVEYDTLDRSVTIYNDDTTVVLYINDNIAYINGRKVAIPDNVVPKLISKLGGETKTMVPVRFISESIGMPVDFDAEDGAILIASDRNAYAMAKEEEEEIYTEPKSAVTDIGYRVKSDTAIKITVETDKSPASVADFTMSNPGRLVVDLNETSLGANDGTIYVNDAGITTIRLGDNGERARIVVDSEYIKSYAVDKNSDTEIVITVKTNPPSEEEFTAPVKTAAPTEAPKPSKAEAAAEPVKAPAVGNKTAKRLVVLDAGHGGADSGAVGELDGEPVLEKDLTLSITYKVKSILESNGIEVSMTRTGDTLPSLVERPTQANEENAAIFVSVHINSVDNAPDANGIEVFYSVENNLNVYGTTSKSLADALLKNMLSETGAVNRGVKTANHAVTKRCNMPASLVECGFITNEKEVAAMSSESYQNKLAEGIAKGIMDTLEEVRTK